VRDDFIDHITITLLPCTSVRYSSC
jgi:hypothetical protein